MTRASILIPTHDKAETLPLTVDSVLRQSITDVEVLVIGDGVNDALRTVIEGLVEADARVRFLDFPKGPHHGERYRHDAVQAASSEAIFYLCDDDLLLPDHVSDLLELLEEYNFVQSLNGYFRPDHGFVPFAADLSDPATIEAHLDPALKHNSVSITGTAHRRSFYDQVGERWDTTPEGEFPDHHQWRKLMRHESFRGATSARVTALQFPTSEDGRSAWTADERLAELTRWHRVVTGPESQRHVDDGVAGSLVPALAQTRLIQARWAAALEERFTLLTHHEARLDEVALELAELRGELEVARRRLARSEQRLAKKNARLAELRGRLRPRS